MKSPAETQRIRKSPEFKQFLIDNHKRGTRKQVARLISEHFDIPVDPSYVSTLMFRYGLRKFKDTTSYTYSPSPYEDKTELLDLPDNFIRDTFLR